MAEPTKQRLLVMNGQRLLQTALDGGWVTSKVDKAGGLKPGIYDLYRSKRADKSLSYDGPLLFADSSSVYQQVGKEVIQHQRADFATVPQAGAQFSVRYDGDQALVAASTAKLGLGRSR